jgi:hypothetical protein
MGRNLELHPHCIPGGGPRRYPGEAWPKEFWRVANASADSLYDVQLLYNGVPQPLQVVALDGVPIGSQDGTGQGTLSTQTDIFS